MIDKVIEILAEFTEMDTADMNESTELVNDRGLNSLDVMRGVVAFEHQLDIEIPDRIIKDLQTIGDIAEYIEKHA